MATISSIKQSKLVLFLFGSLILSVLVNISLLIQRYLPVHTKAPVVISLIVTKIIDGDTFDTREGLRVRLAGVDAPEYPKDCLSLQAKERLTSLILGKQISLEEIKKDTFGRSVAFVFDAGLLINKTLITEGYARLTTESNIVQSRFSHDLSLAQEESKTAMRGIWSSACANTHKNTCVIKGNYRSDTRTKIYHIPECYNYDKITVQLNQKDQWFCTEQEAQMAGFTKSEDCP